MIELSAIEDLRTVRLSEMMARKLPKLLRHADAAGQDSLLVLESEDYQLTNIPVVVAGLEQAAREVERLPTWIVVVDRFTMVHLVFCESHWVLDRSLSTDAIFAQLKRQAPEEGNA